MKKFAYAALAIVSAFALSSADQSVAKSGGFSGGFKGKIAVGKPHFRGRHAHAFHHRRHHRRHDQGFISFGDTSVIAAPEIYQVSETLASNDVTDSIVPPPPYAKSVWRSVTQNQHACSAEHVTVPSSHDGETTITVIRC